MTTDVGTEGLVYEGTQKRHDLFWGVVAHLGGSGRSGLRGARGGGASVLEERRGTAGLGARSLRRRRRFLGEPLLLVLAGTADPLAVESDLAGDFTGRFFVDINRGE